MRLTFISILCLGFVMSLPGCKGDAGPAGPSLTGSITGFVTLVQSDGTRPADYRGVAVSIDGTSLSTVTDSLGKWTIGGLSTGIYSITISKPGYGVYRLENLQFLGGGTLYVARPTLVQPPNFNVALDPVKTTTDGDTLIVAGNVSGVAGPPGSSVYALIAIGTGPNVSASDPNTYLYATSDYLLTGLGTYSTFSTHIMRNTLELAGLTRGTTAYVVVYPLGYGLVYTSYTDQMTGRLVYTSTGTASQVLSVTIP